MILLAPYVAPDLEFVLGPGGVESSGPAAIAATSSTGSTGSKPAPCGPVKELSPTRRTLPAMSEERLTPLERKCIERAAERGQITPSSRTVARALNSTTAHVGRAVRDLRHRGLLAQHDGATCRLTDAGTRLARELTGELDF